MTLSSPLTFPAVRKKLTAVHLLLACWACSPLDFGCLVIICCHKGAISGGQQQVVAGQGTELACWPTGWWT